MGISLRNYFRNKLIERYGVSEKVRTINVYAEQFTYGQREVLLKYIGAPESDIFLAKIPHSGHSATRDFGAIQPEWDYRGQPILQAVWNIGVELDARQKGISRVFAIGSPFIYHLLNSGISMDQIFFNFQQSFENWDWPSEAKDQLAILEGQSVLYMPLHSWVGEIIEPQILKSDFLNRISMLSKIGISLGHLDFLNPSVREAYTAFTTNIHCPGMPNTGKIANSRGGGRDLYFSNMQRIMNEYDVVIGEEFTTGLLYAAALGKKVGILNKSLGHYKDSRYHRYQEIGFTLQERMQMLREDYGWLSNSELSESQKVSNLVSELGLESIKSPENLSNLIPRMVFFNHEV
jgi:hypothetical protein